MYETNSTQWERQTIQKVLLEHIREQKRSRRWAIFFKLVFLILIIYFVYLIASVNKSLNTTTSQTAHCALIDVKGEIDSSKESSADNIRKSLKKAFDSSHVKGVILRINSPGGSPVQARQVYDEIKYQRKKHPDIKLYAAIEDLGASAAYLIAAAADEIYADETSIVGSIGALISSFGFTDAMNKMGVERRLYTAGKHKGILDPFSPRKPDEDAAVYAELEDVHAVFIQNVRDGRGNRLKETPDIFSGLFWSGRHALALGLIDGFASAQSIAREKVKVDKLIDYTQTVTVFDKLSKKVGGSIGDAILFGLGIKHGLN